eukprot:4525556-Karenia_brevis.AAC.1
MESASSKPDSRRVDSKMRKLGKSRPLPARRQYGDSGSSMQWLQPQRSWTLFSADISQAPLRGTSFEQIELLD